MRMIKTATTLDWNGWIRGIFGALISGGAGSVAAGFAVNMSDPAHDISVLKVMGLTFLFSGIVSLAKFLQITPVPEEESPDPPAPGAQAKEK